MMIIARASRALVIVSLLAVVLAAGCVGQLPGSGGPSDLVLRVVADPQQIRWDEKLTLFVDIENIAKDDIGNIAVSAFDLGPFVLDESFGSCSKAIPVLQQSQLESLSCKLALRSDRPATLIQLVTNVNVALRATFEKIITGTTVVDMLSLNEYRRLQTTGKFELGSPTATFGDGQLNAQIEFSKAPPFVAGDVVIAKIYFRNVGSGFIGQLNPKAFKIDQSDVTGQTFKCFFDTPLYSMNGVFPPITCVFTTPPNVQTSASVRITPSVKYQYELRQTVPVSILKPGS